MPGRRPSADSSLLTSAPPFSPLMSSRSVRSLPYTCLRKMKWRGMSCPWSDEWEMGCRRSAMWESEGEAWSEDESVSSSVSREGNVGNGALHVIGLYGPGDSICIGSWRRWH